jgi:hypothetical protein
MAEMSFPAQAHQPEGGKQQKKGQGIQGSL